jgi:hypothetical protein
MVEKTEYIDEQPFKLVIPEYGPCDCENEPDDTKPHNTKNEQK